MNLRFISEIYINAMAILTFILWSILLVFGYSFLTWLYGYLRREYYFSKFPIGPRGYMHPIGNLPDLRYFDERLWNKLRDWSLKYYPIYKIAAGPLTVLNVNGPEEIEQIVSSSKHMEKSGAYQMLLKWLGTGLLLGSGSKWQKRRKILTPAFHFSILQKFISVFNDETQSLVDKYTEECGERKEFTQDVISSITQFTLCTISETSMGIKLNFKTKEDKLYKDSIYEMGKLVVSRTVKPWLWQPAIYYYITPSGYKEKSLIKNLHKFTRSIIEERSKTFDPFVLDNKKDSYSKRKNMALLDILLNAKHSDNSIDDDGIQEEVDTFLFEGHDTTSMAICFGLMILANHPLEQNLIYEEIQQIVGEDNRSPSYEQLMELKYMEMCIKEILRLYPSVPFISRTLSEDIVTKSGHKIGKGSEVNIHIYDLHHNPNVYENPEKFDPDRFLLENSHKRHPFAYLPFSAGPRNCIGQRFAILEMKAVFCGILQKFKLEPVDTPDSLVLIPHIIIKSKNPIKVKFIKRV